MFCIFYNTQNKDSRSCSCGSFCAPLARVGSGGTGNWFSAGVGAGAEGAAEDGVWKGSPTPRSFQGLCSSNRERKIN